MNVKDLHIDAALTNLSVSYAPSGLIADIIAPITTVSKESDKYYVWDRADSFRTYDDKLAQGAVAKTIDFALSNDSYFAEEYGLRTRIVWRELSNADVALRLEQSKTKKLKDSLLISREKRVATLALNTASYAAGLSTTYSGTSQWNNAGYAGDIIKEIDAAKEAVRAACGSMPNTIIIPAVVIPTMTNHSSYRDHYKYTANDISGNGLPPVLRGLKVVVPGAQNTTSAEGASTAAVGDVWGKNLIIAYIDPTDGIDSFTLMKTFRYQEWMTRKYDIEAERSMYIETTTIEDVKVVSNVAGYLIKSVVA